MSIDDAEPKGINLKLSAGDGNKDWGKTVFEAARQAPVTRHFEDAGLHTLKVCMVDPGIVLMRLSISFGKVRDSYFGPPESPGSPW